MTTPAVDMYLGGDWVTIPDVRQNPPVKITAGAKDEDTTSSPSKCALTVNDPDGDYDPSNPTGQWFGDLAENTRLRVRVPLATANDFTHSAATAPDTEHTDLGGEYTDTLVRCTLELPAALANITGALVHTVIAVRWLDDNNYVGAQVRFNTDETVTVQVAENIAGTDRILLGDTEVNELLSTATNQTFHIDVLTEGQVVRVKVWADGDPEPLDWQATCTRATVRAGSVGIYSVVVSGNTNTKPIAFDYTGIAIQGAPFMGEISEFAPAVADESHAAPTVEITASGIGRRVEQGSAPLKSPMFRWFTSEQRWIREGSAESVNSASDVNTLTADNTDAEDVAVGSFFRLLDTNGRYKEDQLFTITSMVVGGSTTAIHFTPDALEPIETGDVANSIREAEPEDAPIAYWPCEEERNATTIASGLVGGAPLTPLFDTPEFAAFDSFQGSAPILKLNNAELNAMLPDYTDTNEAFTLHFLCHFPEDEDAATGQAIVQFYTNGDAEVWYLTYESGGNMEIGAFETLGGSLLFSDTWSMGLQGEPFMVTLTLEQTGGSTVEYDLASVRYPDRAFFRNQQTATGVTTLGKIRRVQVNPGGGYVDVGFGHLAVMPAALRYFNLFDMPLGMQLENTPRRFIRLGFEEGVPITYCQGPALAGGAILGAQQQDTLLDNWQAAAEVDMGRFYESRGAYSFEYRARTSLENQDPILQLDYEGGAVLADFTPTRDDQTTRNDVTVKREGGSQARAVLDTGPKSIATVGRYTDAPTVIAARDTDLPDLAAWRLHLGTVAEDRYPTIKVTTANGAVSLAELLSVGVGSRIVGTNAAQIALGMGANVTVFDMNIDRLRYLDQVLHGRVHTLASNAHKARRRYDDISQLVSGYTLTLDPYVPVLELNCTPESPYRAAVLDDDTCRLDSDATTTNEPIDTTETSINIASTDGVTAWINTTDHPDEFPVDITIGGERMTLTACTSPSGAALSQTMTVTRSVNGVVKEHLVPTEVHLADPVYLPL